MNYIFLFLLLLNISCVHASSPLEQKKIILGVLPNLLNNYHFRYVNIDDSFSKQAFDFYLKRLDYNKRFLLKEDVKKLERYIHLIDDEIGEQSLEFFIMSHGFMQNRIKEAKAYLYHLNSPFDYSKKEKINLTPEELEFCSDANELSERWRKILKYQTLSEIVNAEDRELVTTNIENVNKKNSIKKTSFSEIESQARKTVKENLEKMYYRFEQVNENDRFSDYMNSILNVYDPHTIYFPPQDEKNFNISMSGRLEGIGAVLHEKDGFIKVLRIVPGSASWRQGDLKAGDVILKVGQGSKEPVDVVGMRLDEAVQLIRGKKNSEVRLTVKKINGDVTIVPIVRDVVILEETFAKSAVISMTNNTDNENFKKKIGYIHLPKFYRDFQNKNERSCAKDVQKELKMLKKQNINGVIIDLRNNGGGSLEDVVEMTGLFIKEGPIVQVKRRENKPEIYRDNDPNIVYDGPLLVMVNSFSASASEIFAAAIQDYGRGVIMGSKSTYGKGTVQSLGVLGRYIPKLGKQAGSVKFTIQKFYRINGGSTQLKGVVPDIILPDIYDAIEIGERELDNAMPWAEIDRQPYDLWHLFYDTPKLAKNSEKRIKDNAFFQNISTNAFRLKNQNDDQIYSLNLTKTRNEHENKKEEAKKFENITVTTTLTVKPTKVLSIDDKVEAEKVAGQEQWADNLSRDAYLEEAFFIMEDILEDY